MAIENGDIVKFEYSAYVKTTGQLIDTSDAELAKKEGTFDPQRRYGALIVKVGKGEIIKGLDEALVGLDAGTEKDIEIPAEKAYGNRSEELIRIIPLKQFHKAGIRPVPGQVINIDNKPALIRTVNSGRVVVDFNHPLAGSDLKYHVKVVAVGKTLEEKAKLMAEKYEMDVDVKADGDAVTFNFGEKEFTEKRSRDVTALGILAKELKDLGAKKVLFNGSWTL